jgi:cytidine deaminase
LTEEFITPCGICRQFIREFGKDIEIYMFKGEDWMVKTLEEVLPLSFGPEQLH